MKIKIMATLSCLLLFIQALPMGGSFWSKTKNYAQRGWNVIKENPKVALIVPALYTEIVALESLHKAFNPEEYSDFGYESRIEEETRNRLSQIRPFINKELLKGGLDPAKIKLGFKFSPGYSVNYNQILWVKKLDFVQSGLITSKPGDWITVVTSGGEIIEHWSYETSTKKQELRKQREICAVLQHEIGHLKANDSKRRSLAHALIATSTFSLSYAALNKLFRMVPLKGLQVGLALGTVVPLYATNKILGMAYNRHREARADENVPSEQKYLEGYIDFFERSCKIRKINIRDGYEFDPQSIRGRLNYYWNDEHPTDESRLARAKERLAALEKKESSE